MTFPLEITFKDCPPSEALEAWIHRWADRLDRVYDRVDRCDVVIALPHGHRQGNQFHVNIRLHVPGAHLDVTHEPGEGPAHTNPYVAVRDSFRTARRRLEDHVRRQRT